MTRSGEGPRPRPVPWWGVVLAVAAVTLFTCGLVQSVSCGRGDCLLPPRLSPLLSANALTGLPRLFTTGLFLAAAVSALGGATRVWGGPRAWWVVVAAVGFGLALLKLTSEHSALEQTQGQLVVVGASSVAVAVGGGALLVAGRRWRVEKPARVVGAFLLYAVAALGLDQVTGLVAQFGRGGFTLLATYAEEGGEALAALLLLVTVHDAAAGRRPRHAAPRPSPQR